MTLHNLSLRIQLMDKEILFHAKAKNIVPNIFNKQFQYLIFSLAKQWIINYLNRNELDSNRADSNKT